MAARKPSERSHRTEITQDLNLAPFMSILIILIPLLIFAFQFYEITVQSVAAPKLGPVKKQKEQTEDDKPPLNLTVLIGEEGFVIKQQAQIAEADEPTRIPKRRFTLTHVIPTENGERTTTEDVIEYDFPKLYSTIAQKKKDYPEEDTVNIGADFSIPWRTIARTIDCVRVRLASDKAGKTARDDFVELDDYRKAMPLTKKNEYGELDQVAMFPKVVFVVAE